MVRDDFWVQEEFKDSYVPPPWMDYPGGTQARSFNRVERAVERWPNLLAGVVWDPAASRIVLKAVPAGIERANKIAARLAAAGVAEPIVIDQVRHSTTELDALHTRVIEDNYGWLGRDSRSVTGSQVDTRTNAVLVDLEDPLSEEMLNKTRKHWASDVRLRFAPGSRMIEQ